MSGLCLTLFCALSLRCWGKLQPSFVKVNMIHFSQSLLPETHSISQAYAVTKLSSLNTQPKSSRNADQKRSNLSWQCLKCHKNLLLTSFSIYGRKIQL